MLKSPNEKKCREIIKEMVHYFDACEINEIEKISVIVSLLMGHLYSNEMISEKVAKKLLNLLPDQFSEYCEKRKNEE
jgi:hypothetical protein